MENLINIPGRLHSVAIEQHVAGANEIYDDNQDKLQDEINSILVTNSITNVQYIDGQLRFYNSKGHIVKVISTPQEQSDYAETDSSKVTFIKNKPTIPSKTSDLTNDSGFITDISGKQDVIQDLDDIRAGAALGATSIQEHQSLASLVDNGSYNSNDKTIELKHGATVLSTIDATAFIKDGMVDSVTISNGYLVITFNTDAGKEAISLALTDIFNPENYYDKTTTDNLLANKVDKVSGKGLSTNDYTTANKNKLSALPTNAVLTETLSGLDERLENTEEALTENLPIESFVMDDYSIGSVSIAGVNISSDGNVPIKECNIPYVSGNTITIDGVTYSKAIRKDYTAPYTDGILAQFDFEEKGIATVYYGFGGGGSRNDYYLQFIFSSDDSTILNKRLATREVYDTGHEIGKITLDIEKKGTLTIKAIEEDAWDSSYLSDNGNRTNIVRIDFKAMPLISVGDLKDSLSTVATSGSYNDLSDKPTIPDAQIQSDWNQSDNTKKDFIKNKPTIPVITGKADKVSNATNGNFAALDSNGNLTDSGHKHSDYLTQHQDLSNYVQKSNTSGLLKNDGTIDTTQYTTNTGTITGITMNGQSKGTSGNVDLGTVITDVSGKEDKMTITAASGTTLTPVMGNYYRLTAVGVLAITLPTITGATKLQAVTLAITTDTTCNVTFTAEGNEPVCKQDGFLIEPSSRYEVSAFWNGSEWTLTLVKFS